MRKFLLLPLLALLAACSSPLDTPIPKDIANIESIRPAMEKLKPEEKELVASYLVRHAVGSALGQAFGMKTEPIPDGMTIGKAIAEQREFAAKKKAEEDARKAAREKAEADRKALAEQMKQMLVVTLTDVELHRASYRDNDVKSFIRYTFAMDNKGGKDISGIKGIATFRDKFGDTVAEIGFKSEQLVPAGKSISVRLASEYNQFSDNDRKLANIDPANINFALAPEVVLFADGTRFETKPAKE